MVLRVELIELAGSPLVPVSSALSMTGFLPLLACIIHDGRSYSTHEEMVASAGGGLALYGINFFSNEVDITLKPYAPLLTKPTYVEM